MPRIPPLVIGHRGAPGYRPEHSRASYELALALGVDAVEPDVVPTRDGVLVVRHENEISGTTDVADRPEFRDRRATKTVDGEMLTGWFTEDFTWAELSTLRCRERLPGLRPESTAFDDTEPVLRLRDVLDLVRDARGAREVGVVLEMKHATYFSGIGFDVAALVEHELRAAGWADGAHPLVVESFELSVLRRVRERGIRATWIYLLEETGAPADLVAAHGAASAPPYAQTLSPTGLDGLVGIVDGISVDRRMILDPDAHDRPRGPAAFVAEAHARGLLVYTWTCRAENAFLLTPFRTSADPAEIGRYAEEWAVIRDAAVDGVFVDHADLGVAFFRG
ncbi:Glycerophosphodiester phosphodiesterase, periplasmic [Microbacterium lemovicicum]|uniref:glycerophosphodiester phosphodiesterase n=1 Tax=Microbacterium lemovicicum TaxID=1072463 RepID=A0A3Q9IYB2_9MICO|nr:glycerophosphodiester phosphodiesterase family protein [Microbacterium lemovicicum]AZS35958.1 Glycerophosphodiester phosphodiesterase, periplasmic [Microbacterium lemovicicum]